MSNYLILLISYSLIIVSCFCLQRYENKLTLKKKGYRKFQYDCLCYGGEGYGVSDRKTGNDAEDSVCGEVVQRVVLGDGTCFAGRVNVACEFLAAAKRFRSAR